MPKTLTSCLKSAAGIKQQVQVPKDLYSFRLSTSCMEPKKSIHDYSKKYEGSLKRLSTASISETNKKIIKKFDRACFIEGLSKPRRIKIIFSLIILAEKYLPVDFDKATKDDLKDAVLKIDIRDDYSPWTKESYRAIIKKFYTWLTYGDDYKKRMEYPKIIAWLRVGTKKKDLPKVKASDILTEHEVKSLIEVADYVRDKAFISMLYELGARIGEIGGLQLKDISKDKYSYIIDLEGKTGNRTPRIVISAPYLTNWLNDHPLKDNPDAPLWVMLGARNKNKKMMYPALRALVKRLKKKSRIKKRIYTHLFRHTRVTHLLSNKQINEAQAKVYFGWTPDSTMLSEYSHLISSDVNNAILEMHGIKTEENKESQLKPKQCSMCNTINTYDARFCQKCGKVLDVQTAIELDEKRSSTDEMLAKVLKENPNLRDELLKKILAMGFAENLS